MALETPWKPYDLCPCGCQVIAWKLNKVGHGVGCACRPCIGKRNRRKGQANEARRHRDLGGVGRTPADELPHVYPVNVVTEDKSGAQVPAKFVSFIGSEWTRHAFAQAKRKLPVGVDALPALYLHPEHGGAWLVVEVRPNARAAPEGTARSVEG